MEAVGELLPPDGGKVSEAVAEGVSVEAGQAAVVPLVDGDGHPLVEGDHRHPLVDGDALVHDVLRCEALQGLRADVSKPGGISGRGFRLEWVLGGNLVGTRQVDY